MKIKINQYMGVLGMGFILMSTYTFAQNNLDYEICMKAAKNQMKELKSCQMDEYKLQEKRVDVQLKKLLSKLEDNQRELLQINQDRWLIQRKKMCGIRSVEIQDVPIVQLHCLVKATVTRAELLEVQLRNKNLL